MLEISRPMHGALDPTIYPLINVWGFIDQNYRIPSEQENQELLSLTGYKNVALNDDVVIVPEGIQMDLSAVDKGYAGAQLGRTSEKAEITSALLDIGGNIHLVGIRPDGSA